MKKILFILLTLFFTFVLVQALRQPDTFLYECSGLIQATPEKIFPYLNDFKLGNAWSPYEREDLSMKHVYLGAGLGTGAIMEFEGNSDVGAGRLEILTSRPPNEVVLELQMQKPITAVNQITYRLTPEAGGTRFSWSMSGKTNWIGRILGVFIDCSKMVTGDFEAGILNLKTVVESAKP
jgi:uncharacterized protein YndB with AHSA1/START domain